MSQDTSTRLMRLFLLLSTLVTLHHLLCSTHSSSYRVSKRQLDLTQDPSEHHGMNIPSTNLKVCLVQPPLRRDGQDPLHAIQLVKDLMRKAMDEHGSVDLFVLPELCPIGYSEDSFTKYLPLSDENRGLHHLLEGEMENVARSLNAAICYGTMGRFSDENKVTIRQVVLGKSGEEIGFYDKIHICDYALCAETRFFSPGSGLFSFSLGGWKFGILVCADMRYPELAQSYVRDHGVHVLLQPAAFARDCSFRTWRSFRETRAVETGCYFLGVNYAGENFGESSLNPPWIDEDHEPTVLGTEASYIVATLNPTILQEARSDFPFFRHTVKPSARRCCGARPSDDWKGN